MEIFFCAFLIKLILLCDAAHTLAHHGTCAPTNMASNSQYTLPPQSSLRESTGSKSQLRSKQSSNEPPPENFVAIGGCFEHVLCYALGWLKKEREKMNNSDFRPFQVYHFKIVTTHCYYYCRLGQAL